MKKSKFIIFLLLLLFAVLMSLPWLVPHCGFFALFGLIPLLCAERIAGGIKLKAFFWWYYLAFFAWNFGTTFWVCGATVGGGLFASLANAFQMAVIFGAFRISKKRFKGILPYVFLMVTWIAWERFYFDAEISWPWLTLGYAFAQSTKLIQWYSVTGVLGGSLWIWLCNLSIFGIMSSMSEGSWFYKTYRQQLLVCLLVFVVFAAPITASLVIYGNYREKSESKISTIIGQPNFDPYEKFKSMAQAEQNDTLLGLFQKALETEEAPDLFLAPETFTSDIDLSDFSKSATYNSFQNFLADKPNSSLLFGASSYECYQQLSCPNILAYKYDWGWVVSHNSAIITDCTSRTEVFHKSKLVVGTELTPYPKLFTKLDALICQIMGYNGYLMGRCVGQKKQSLLHLTDGTPIACAICYESVYGEYCAEFVRKGAKLLTVITNDAWWGNTPGYKQHFSYSAVRAIELRRDIVRCGNTGISAFINQKGEVVAKSSWWERTTLSGEANLNSEMTIFVKYGDIVGKVCSLAFLLMLLAFLVKLITRKE